MSQISPAGSTEQYFCSAPVPNVALEATPDDTERFFANIVITDLPDPSTHRPAIDKILHGVRHYGAHGDSSGRKASARKIRKGEPIENTEFRLAISYYFLAAAPNQLIIQITQNVTGRALLLSEAGANNPEANEQETANSSGCRAIQPRLVEFIASAPDEQTAAFRRRVVASELKLAQEREKLKQAHNPEPPGRLMTDTEKRKYFGQLTNICYERVAAYIEQAFSPATSDSTPQP